MLERFLRRWRNPWPWPGQWWAVDGVGMVEVVEVSGRSPSTSDPIVLCTDDGKPISGWTRGALVENADFVWGWAGSARRRQA